MILPTLLLQKPSAKSKAKDHSAALGRRLAAWKKGEINELIREVRCIQGRFNASRRPKKQEDLAKTFAKLVMEGKVSSAMKLLDKEHNVGVLNLNEEVIADLKAKHPNPEPATNRSLLHGPVMVVPAHFFDAIDEQSVLKAA